MPIATQLCPDRLQRPRAGTLSELERGALALDLANVQLTSTLHVMDLLVRVHTEVAASDSESEEASENADESEDGDEDDEEASDDASDDDDSGDDDDGDKDKEEEKEESASDDEEEGDEAGSESETEVCRVHCHVWCLCGIVAPERRRVVESDGACTWMCIA